LLNVLDTGERVGGKLHWKLPVSAYENRTEEASQVKLPSSSWAKLLSVAVLLFIVITGLGPPKWQPRTSLGWQADHFLGYFVITLMVCFAWPRPWLVGSALVVFAALLETLQSLTPDRSPNVLAVIYGVAGVLLAALLAELFIRVRNREKG
jgi:VanZ family protein